ncbi:MAG TPA: flagellar biosynthesis anti-sigma factor FlgM [Planctomycetota bacterium]|nr:flagellar biosynthesis anti-sigma factor FlgM [Planctomycetota bacterium]
MDIGSTSGVGGAGRVEGPQNVGKIRPPASLSQAGPADQVDISSTGKITSDALALPAVRTEKVEEMKKLIQSGRFDTEARLEAALDGFLAENRDALDE